jgi:hypothetical protein
MSRKVSNRQELLHLFKNPPREYADVVCWSWETGKLDKKRLTSQLEELADKGVRGTWFYPRMCRGEPYGTQPAYFTEPWWDFVRHSLSEHKRLGLHAGFSAWEGLNFWQEKLLAEREQRPELQGRRLVLHEAAGDGPGPVVIEVPAEQVILSAAAYRLVDGRLDGTSRQDAVVTDGRAQWRPVEGDWKVTVVASEPHYLDHLNPAVTDRWLEIFWGVYEARVGEFMGDSLQAYLQDEILAVNGNILWSTALAERFTAEKRYDPIPHLAGLFHDIGDLTDKIRCDYYEVMSAMLEDNLYRPMSQWNRDRGMEFGTIAPMGRNDLLAQTRNHGDFSRLMRWFDITGNEDPGRAGPGDRRFVDAKLSSSIIHHYQGKRAGVLGYYLTGWGMTMEENLAWTFENYAYGINLYNGHLVYNTLAGWYEFVPPTCYIGQPYWQHWRVFSHGIARLSAVMSQGTAHADVALLYPLTTIHANWFRGTEFSGEAHDAANETCTLAGHLYRSGVDFDFMDEHVLEQAEVRDGKLVVAGMAYRALLLPPLTTIRRDSLAKLKAFYDSGGLLVALRRLPGASSEHGRNDPLVRAGIREIFGIASEDEYVGSTACLTEMSFDVLRCPTRQRSDMAMPKDGFVQTILKQLASRDSVRRNTNENGGQAIFVPAHEMRTTGGSAGPRIPSLIHEEIGADVACSDKDVFHAHRRVEDADVYFLYNVRQHQRNLQFTLRAEGDPEAWEPFKGRVLAVHRFAREHGKTTVRLTMERNEGIMLVLSRQGRRPAVVDDNLTEIADVAVTADGIKVRGFSRSGGRKKVQVEHEGRTYLGQVTSTSPPAAIGLGGDWDFELRPTLDNRWGDFRHPPAAQLIGPEVRCVRYMEEGDRPGTEQGWHEAASGTAHWPTFVCSFGPYFHAIGPFGPGEEPSDLVRDAIDGRIDLDRRYSVGAGSRRWERFSFSRKFGHHRAGARLSGRRGVSDHFIFFDGPGGDQEACRYLFTHVQADASGRFRLRHGADNGQVRQVWINGKEMFSPASPADSDGGGVHVQLDEGLNTVFAQVVHLEGKPVEAFIVLRELEDDDAPIVPPIPRLKWFTKPSGLTYDIMPERRNPVGWYRFEVPPGTRAMGLELEAQDVEAWVEGRPVEIRDGRIELDSATDALASVAVRITQKQGAYAAAAIPESIKLECEPTRAPLGDWCDIGLESYSGGAVYEKNVELGPQHLTGQAILDLGQVNVTAELVVNGDPVGTSLARPHRFDISEHLREGVNRLEVTVFNTLANHYGKGEISSDHVREGQTVSGLIGPVTLEFLTKATVICRPCNARE